MLTNLPSNVPKVKLRVRKTIRRTPRPKQRSVHYSLGIGRQVSRHTRCRLFYADGDTGAAYPGNPSQMLYHSVFSVFSCEGFSVPETGRVGGNVMLGCGNGLLLIGSVSVRSPATHNTTALCGVHFSSIHAKLGMRRHFGNSSVISAIALAHHCISFSCISNGRCIFVSGRSCAPCAFAGSRVRRRLLFVPRNNVPSVRILA